MPKSATSTHKTTTTRIPLDEYRRAEAIVAKIQATNPAYLMADFQREAFSRELDRHTPGRTTVTDFNAKELAAVMSVVAPQQVANIREVFNVDPTLTPHLFLKYAIEGEVSSRLHTKPEPKVTLESLAKQLEQALDLINQDRQEGRKTGLLTALMAKELGIDPA